MTKPFKNIWISFDLSKIENIPRDTALFSRALSRADQTMPSSLSTKAVPHVGLPWFYDGETIPTMATWQFGSKIGGDLPLVVFQCILSWVGMGSIGQCSELTTKPNLQFCHLANRPQFMGHPIIYRLYPNKSPCLSYIYIYIYNTHIYIHTIYIYIYNVYMYIQYIYIYTIYIYIYIVIYTQYIYIYIYCYIYIQYIYIYNIYTIYIYTYIQYIYIYTIYIYTIYINKYIYICIYSYVFMYHHLPSFTRIAISGYKPSFVIFLMLQPTFF